MNSVRSVLAQTISNFELIVVDDGSTDDTKNILNSLTDPRISYVYQENLGRSSARNNGGSVAKGNFFGFLDFDDLYKPDCLENHLKSISNNREAGLFIGGYQIIDESNAVIGERRVWIPDNDAGINRWLFDCFGIPSSTIIKREWFINSGGFDPELETAEDWGIYLTLVNLGCKVAFTPSIVCQYRQHSGNSIHNLLEHQNASIKVINRFFLNVNLNPDILAMKNASLAWIHVNFAKKYLLTNKYPKMQQNLKEAVTIDPDLKKSKKIELLEYMLTPANAIDPDQLFEEFIKFLPDGLRPNFFERRIVRARIYIAEFFRLIDLKQPDLARNSLIKALRLDPRWLFNRGVLSFCVRSIAKFKTRSIRNSRN